MTKERTVTLLWWGRVESPADLENGQLDEATILGAYPNLESANVESARLRGASLLGGGALLALEYTLNKIGWDEGFVRVGLDE